MQQLLLFKEKPPKPKSPPEERKLVYLRECQTPDAITMCDTPKPSVRTLKIEAVGDFCRGVIKPKIRLVGHWLERAGFNPGNRVHVACVAPGVIELRSPYDMTVIETKQSSSRQPHCPF